MLYHLLLPYASDVGVFNLFRYLTFRSMGAIFTAFLLTFFLGDPFIRWLKSKQADGQPIRHDGPESHLLTKKGTPTMGGGLILFSLAFSTLLWANLSNTYTWVIMGVTLFYGIIGAVDDYLKLTQRNTRGLSGKVKLLAQSTIAFIACAVIVYLAAPETATSLAIPFTKDLYIELGWFFFVFGGVVIVGSSNAVNLTDGLDGLAIVPVMIVALCFAIICYLAGNAIFANYLQIQYVRDVGELAVFCAAFMGAGLGFLWYNTPPAKVFMGDTGSLAAGGALGTMSIITKHELVLAIIGGLFVVEAISVIIQVGYFKCTGKRVFLMAPIHHHFEKKGWSEPTIVIRFWIIAAILALIGLSTLKLR